MKFIDITNSKAFAKAQQWILKVEIKGMLFDFAISKDEAERAIKRLSLKKAESSADSPFPFTVFTLDK